MALIGEDICLFVDPDVCRADPGALPAIRAGLLVPVNLQDTEQTESTQKGPVGAEISAPETTQKDGEDQEDDQCPQGKGAYVGKKMEHLDVCHHVVGAVKEMLQGRGIHFQENGLEKKE